MNINIPSASKEQKELGFIAFNFLVDLNLFIEQLQSKQI